MELQPNRITRAAAFRVAGDALPEQSEHDEVAVLDVDARAAQLDDFAAQRLESLEFKFLRGVIAEIVRGVRAGLQPVGADNVLRRQMLDDEMIANGVKRVFIEAGGEGLFQPFVEFEVENFKAQRLRGADFPGIPRQPRGIMRRGTDHQTDGFNS